MPKKILKFDRSVEEGALIERANATELSVLVPTSEDWAPSLDRLGQPLPHHLRWGEGKFLRLRILRLSSGDWRVCVWGGDDCGRELDYPVHREHAYYLAKAMYETIKAAPVITFALLESHGFHGA